MAANIKDRQMAEQQEQEEVKRLVLNYNQRQEEEIYNGMSAYCFTFPLFPDRTGMMMMMTELLRTVPTNTVVFLCGL